MMARGYIDTSIGKAIVAQSIAFTLFNYASDNKKAVYVAEVLVNSSANIVLDHFNFEEVLGDLLKGINLPGDEDIEEEEVIKTTKKSGKNKK